MPVVARQDLAHRGLAREIGGAHPVAGRLLAHLVRRAEVRGDDLAAGPGRGVRGREQRVEVELGHATTRFRIAGELGRARGDDAPVRVGIGRDERFVVRVEHGRARFAARQQPAQVVPRSHREVRVDVRVEPAGRDLAQRERAARRRRGTASTAAAARAAARC